MSSGHYCDDCGLAYYNCACAWKKEGMSAMKLCVDCKYLSASSMYKYRDECLHPNNMSQNPVTGGYRTNLTPLTMRQLPNNCGPDAKFFEPKPKKKGWFR